MARVGFSRARFSISMLVRCRSLENAFLRSAAFSTGRDCRTPGNVTKMMSFPVRLTSRGLYTSHCTQTDSPVTAATQKVSAELNATKKTEVLLEELIRLLDSDKIQLIDVREPREIGESGSIPNSINIPVTQLKGALSLSDELFLMTFGVEKPRKDSVDVVYYGLSAIKSAAAVEIAQKLGFRRARHYIGGWDEWSVKCRSEGTY